jgi:hypothetical protein
MIKHLGCGPCVCGYRNEDVVLTGETEPAPDGGTFWRVAEGEQCGGCGRALTTFYEGPIVLDLPQRVTRKEYA